MIQVSLGLEHSVFWMKRAECNSPFFNDCCSLYQKFREACLAIILVSQARLEETKVRIMNNYNLGTYEQGSCLMPNRSKMWLYWTAQREEKNHFPYCLENEQSCGEERTYLHYKLSVDEVTL